MTVLLYPDAATEDSQHALAPRLPTLSGLRLGLLVNGKRNSDHLLRDIAELLGQRYRLASVLELTKPTHGRAAPAAMHDQLAANCDAVITAIGD